MKILALNAGSSSLKASLFELTRSDTDRSRPHGLLWEAERADSQHSLVELLAPLWSGREAMLSSPSEIDAVGHRVVHGGSDLQESAPVTSEVLAEIARAAEYAPSHNAGALGAMASATALFGADVPQVAVFDTAFHRTLPPAAFTYAGPYAWLEQGIRRFGFHGVNHEYVSQRARELLNAHDTDLRVVSCHLGSGCSLAAIRNGESVDTTMGFTPLDGLPMARRSGAIDPGILLHLLRLGGATVDSLDDLLNHDSGLAGLSGTSGDMRTVLVAVDAGNDRARLALDVFVHHVRQGIAAMAASMGGVNALVFTGGIGEHSPRVRAEICASLGFLGVVLDEKLNAGVVDDADIADGRSRTRVLVIVAQENWMIARECLRLL
ncbi:MAG: acetate/propionate family kinase [Gemmatimonadaceae bacterium]|nr:acetate/propionate family kinase [Gemmatimonadaceae bacterium]